MQVQILYIRSTHKIAWWGKIPTPLDVADGNITIVITHHAIYFTDDLQADLQFGSGVKNRN